MMRKITINGCSVTVLPVVKGLVSEADEVSKAFEEVMPDAVGMSIGKEELAGLHKKDEYENYEQTDLEEIYGAILETFGKVELPPPCYVRGMDICEENHIPLIPIDLNDEMYTEAYCGNLTTWQMIRESFFARKAPKKRWDVSTPQNFVVQWDSRVNRAKGFRKLEDIREKHMASTIQNMTRKYHNILALVECERAEGVIRSLSIVTATASSQPSVTTSGQATN